MLTSFVFCATKITSLIFCRLDFRRMALLLKGVVKAIALKHYNSAVNEFRRKDEDDLYRLQ